MQLIEAFVHNPVKIAVGVLLVSLFGFIALWRMPMQLTPEVEIPKISITTRWPGASPGEVEREIVQEQETHLKSVEGLAKMTAECSDSVGTIVLEFGIGADLSEALLKVNAQLQQVQQYPEDAREPVISTSDPRANAIAWFILRPRMAKPEEIAAFQGKNPDLAELLEPVRKARGVGLATRRIHQLVEDRPDLRERLAPLVPPDIEVPKLRRFAEDFIQAQFERVRGVSIAGVNGGREEEMQVVVDPQRLAAHGLTISQVRYRLREQNRDISAGDVWEGKRRWVVRTLGRFHSEDQVGDVVLTMSGGAPVYLRDVAEVRLGFKKPDAVVKNFGTACLAINCVRETGANVLDTMAGLRATVKRLNTTLLNPRGLELIQVYDETDYIYSAIDLVRWNIVIGGLLTIGVLLLFLRSWRSTIVIAIAIPTSLIGTFLLLDMMGRSLNVISLAGLAFAVGMLVDNAVVVLENCYRHSQMGDNPFAASVRGAKEVWGAVIASTLTTLAVFLPVIFVQEEAGQLFRDIALAISCAVGLSLIVSITVIPTAAARLLRREPGGELPEGRALDASQFTETAPTAVASGNGQGKPELGRREAGYRSYAPRRLCHLTAAALGAADRSGARFVRHVVKVNGFVQQSLGLKLTVVFGFVLGAVGLSWLMMPKVEYLPVGNRNQIVSLLLPPPGTNIESTLELGTQLEAATRDYWDVDPDDPEIYTRPFPPLSDYFFVAATRRVFFGMRSLEPHRVGQLVGLMRMKTGELPGTIAQVFQRPLFSSELGGGRTIDIEITGPELPQLVAMGQKVFDEVEQLVPGARAFPKPSLDLSSPEVHVIRKSELASDLQLGTDELGYTVNALVDGAYATDYYMGGDKIDLTILGHARFAERTQDLLALPVVTPSGDLTRLEGVADIRLAGGPEQINRRERQRAITISVMPPDEIPLEAAVDTITEKIVKPRIESGEIGSGYLITLAGTADKLRATWNALRWNFVLALLITYLLMAALFESWLYPLVIILSVPLGAVGGFLGLWAVNAYLSFWPNAIYQSLDVLTMLGFVILIGTVVNNPILIVHQSLNHMREDGMTPNRAILESVRIRIRPIFMTTTTTVFGLCPLVLFSGAGSELYRGLGAVVLGGLIFSTFTTLLVVPTLFSLMMETKAAIAHWMGWTSLESENAATSFMSRPVGRHSVRD